LTKSEVLKRGSSEEEEVATRLGGSFARKRFVIQLRGGLRSEEEEEAPLISLRLYLTFLFSLSLPTTNERRLGTILKNEDKDKDGVRRDVTSAEDERRPGTRRAFTSRIEHATTWTVKGQGGNRIEDDAQETKSRPGTKYDDTNVQ
jgi:hypothetical protein